VDIELIEQDIYCPYCGERIGLLLDISAGSQTYIEDCQVCCQPMQVNFDTADGQCVNLQVSGAE